MRPKDDLKLQQAVLEYFEYLKKIFKNYQDFLLKAEMFFKGAEIMEVGKENLTYRSDNEDYPKLSYEEFNRKKGRIPKEIPRLINYTPSGKTPLSFVDRELLREQLVWLIDTFGELELSFESAPKGTDGWFKGGSF
jgi:hypothetical protein